MIDEPLRALFQEVASHLSGRAVILHITPPPVQYGWGECYLADGTARIDISPNLCTWSAYETLLHETAHALLHVHLYKPVELPPASYTMTPAQWQAYQVDPIEAQASDLAAVWAAEAEQRTAGKIHPNMPDDWKVQILLTSLKELTR